MIKKYIVRALSLYMAASLAASLLYNLWSSAAWDIASHRHGLTIVSVDNGGVWYSLDVSGNLAGCSVWCAVSQLAHHFRHLCRVTGNRWKNSPDLCILRPDMIPAY